MIMTSFIRSKETLVGQARRCAAEEHLAQIHRQRIVGFYHGQIGCFTMENGGLAMKKKENSPAKNLNLPNSGFTMTKGVLNHQKIWFYHEPIFYHEKEIFCHEQWWFHHEEITVVILITETGDSMELSKMGNHNIIHVLLCFMRNPWWYPCVAKLQRKWWLMGGIVSNNNLFLIWELT